MSDVPRTFVRGPLPTGGGDRARIPSDELRARRCGGDFSHIGPICTESSPPPSSIPDDSEDFPCIPSTSTGLWGDDPVTISTEMMGSPTASPIVGCPPLPVPSPQACEREPLTEAQQIAAQYRQRRRDSEALSSSRVRNDGTVACDRCGHCGVQFTDDDHKDEHPNSCPSLPTSHKIESLEDGPSGPLQSLLNHLHL